MLDRWPAPAACCQQCCACMRIWGCMGGPGWQCHKTPGCHRIPGVLAKAPGVGADGVYRISRVVVCDRSVTVRSEAAGRECCVISIYVCGQVCVGLRSGIQLRVSAGHNAVRYSIRVVCCICTPESGTCARIRLGGLNPEPMGESMVWVPGCRLRHGARWHVQGRGAGLEERVCRKEARPSHTHLGSGESKTSVVSERAS